MRGREKYFSKEYEPPTEDFVDIDTSYLNIEESINKLLKYNKDSQL